MSRIPGLDNANLAPVAPVEIPIEIPSGYRLVDLEHSRAFLQRTRNPIPKGLIGILTPESGQWWAVVEFNAIGHLNNVENERLDPAAILQAVRDQNQRENPLRLEQNRAAVVSVDYQKQPVYDAASHSMGWAFTAETQSAQSTNSIKFTLCTLLLFGRAGVLEITAVRPPQAAAELLPLDQLTKDITFKEGQRYEDYRSGDKVAKIGLQQFIVDADHSAPGKKLTSRIVAWATGSLIVCLLGGGVVCYVILHRRWRVRNALEAHGHLVSAPDESVALQNGSANGAVNGAHGLKPEPRKVRVNGGRGGKFDRRGNGRRKMAFDYAGFYTDFVMSTGYVAMSSPPPAVSLVSNEQSGWVGEPAPLPAATPKPGTEGVNLVDLIACQKALIEEQTRLIQQQTRLIEEKNKLILEQTEFLGRQSAANENQYPLKFE